MWCTYAPSKKKGGLKMSYKRERRLSVRAVRRTPPDLRKLSRALIALAMAQAQAEADAQAEHQGTESKEGKRRAA
jgi:hypothetical protein